MNVGATCGFAASRVSGSSASGGDDDPFWGFIFPLFVLVPVLAAAAFVILPLVGG